MLIGCASYLGHSDRRALVSCCLPRVPSHVLGKGHTPERPEEQLRICVYDLVTRNFGLPVLALVPGWERAIDEEVRCLEVGGTFGQLLDWVSPVGREPQGSALRLVGPARN